MTGKSTDEVASKIQQILTDNPVGNRTITDLLHGHGIATSQDQHPALEMTPKGPIGYDMERVRKAGLAAGKKDKSAKRMAQNRARAERKAQFDALADSPIKPSQERLAQAWGVVTPLVPIVQAGARAKQAWASRFLGSTADDLPSMVIEQMILVLAKSDKDLAVLARAAQELGAQQSRTGRIPGNQEVDEKAKAERKEVGKARKWLMGLVNNRIMGALVDSYTAQRNLRWDNLDLIATVMSSISGPADDAFIARHKADRAPSFLGTRFASPGGIDGNLLALALAGAITDRRLDALVELLLDEERVRTDGSFAWAENAEHVFMLSPKGGAQVWSLVVRATQHLVNPRRAQADAARTHVRNLFDWMPGLIVQTVDAFDYQAVERYTVCKRRVAVMASAFEGVVDEVDTSATVQEALRVVISTLATAQTGEDVVRSVVFA